MMTPKIRWAKLYDVTRVGFKDTNLSRAYECLADMACIFEPADAIKEVRSVISKEDLYDESIVKILQLIIDDEEKYVEMYEASERDTMMV